MDFLLRDIQERETVRIISGEANPEIITAEQEEALLDAFETKEAIIKVIAGPVICVKPDSNGERSNGNPYLRLAHRSVLTVYPARLRLIRHLRIFGERKVLLENYHESLAPPSERKTEEIMNHDVAQKCAYDFELDIQLFQNKRTNGNSTDSNKVLCLTKEEIGRVKETLQDPEVAINLVGIESSTFYTITSMLCRPGMLFDFLTFEKAQKILQKLNMFQPHMVVEIPS